MIQHIKKPYSVKKFQRIKQESKNGQVHWPSRGNAIYQLHDNGLNQCSESREAWGVSERGALTHSLRSKFEGCCSPSLTDIENLSVLLTLTHAHSRTFRERFNRFFLNFAPIFLAKSLDCREISKWVSWWKKKKPDLQWGLLIDPAGPFAEGGKRHAHLSSWRHWNDFWKRVSHKQHSCLAKILFFSNKSSQLSPQY